jgi:hypothetical protein
MPSPNDALPKTAGPVPWSLFTPDTAAALEPDIPCWPIQLAQALHHGTDHRSQVCTAITALGVEPPPIDVLDFGIRARRVVEITPTS